MFKAIASFFRTVNKLFIALELVADVGVSTAEQFKTESDIALAKKKATLKEQSELLS